jgi:hypothetical protein
VTYWHKSSGGSHPGWLKGLSEEELEMWERELFSRKGDENQRLPKPVYDEAIVKKLPYVPPKESSE